MKRMSWRSLFFRLVTFGNSSPWTHVRACRLLPRNGFHHVRDGRNSSTEMCVFRFECLLRNGPWRVCNLLHWSSNDPWTSILKWKRFQHWNVRFQVLLPCNGFHRVRDGRNSSTEMCVFRFECLLPIGPWRITLSNLLHWSSNDPWTSISKWKRFQHWNVRFQVLLPCNGFHRVRDGRNSSTEMCVFKFDRLLAKGLGRATHSNLFIEA